VNAIDVSGAYAVYAVTSLAVTLVVAAFLPETKGISEIKIANLFQRD
jgi:hypothetical protein